ncbi:MAG: hypothetical protein S4CHLAM6_15850 [Chlamydiae bacterium]|nr:hypothetical protein [Chlamydiota bacterium]
MISISDCRTLYTDRAKYNLGTPTKLEGDICFQGDGGEDAADKSKFELTLSEASSVGVHNGKYKITYLEEKNPNLQVVEGHVRAFFEEEGEKWTLKPSGFADDRIWHFTTKAQE